MVESAFLCFSLLAGDGVGVAVGFIGGEANHIRLILNVGHLTGTGGALHPRL